MQGISEEFSEEFIQVLITKEYKSQVVDLDEQVYERGDIWEVLSYLEQEGLAM